MKGSFYILPNLPCVQILTFVEITKIGTKSATHHLSQSFLLFGLDIYPEMWVIELKGKAFKFKHGLLILSFP